MVEKLKRLPIIRHVRYWLVMRAINNHYARWASLGMLPVHADEDYAEADKIWRGER